MRTSTHYETSTSNERSKEINTLRNIHIQRAKQGNQHTTKHPHPTSEAMLRPPLEVRHLVEEREKIFALFREEEKAV